MSTAKGNSIQRHFARIKLSRSISGDMLEMLPWEAYHALGPRYQYVDLLMANKMRAAIQHLLQQGRRDIYYFEEAHGS